MLYYVWKGHKNQAEPPGGKCSQRQEAREGDDAAIELENLFIDTSKIMLKPVERTRSLTVRGPKATNTRPWKIRPGVFATSP